MRKKGIELLFLILSFRRRLIPSFSDFFVFLYDESLVFLLDAPIHNNP